MSDLQSLFLSTIQSFCSAGLFSTLVVCRKVEPEHVFHICTCVDVVSS